MTEPFRKVPREIYEHIDNGIYDELGDLWWRPDSSFFQTKEAFNPVRIGYVKKTLIGPLGLDPHGKTALEVGCGGGILCEEIARMGFVTTGVDPSGTSLRTAAAHAREGGLDIRYVRGVGEALPCISGSFDAVFCCDVLEHVRDLAGVIAEVSRVLKPGGAFCYDTFNRTWFSKLAAIKIAQEWKRWAFIPPRIHVFGMFIKPGEMKAMLRTSGLEWREHRGIALNVSPFRALGFLRRRAEGTLTYAELGEKIRLVESRFRGVMYWGLAVKHG
jgi:2-polyprenyl-6-hydroxyphenyl methylase/3-demethylubiquinone-9 3-methyltransferase